MWTDDQSQAGDPRDRKRYYYDYTLFRRIVTSIARQVFKLFTIIKADGVAHLPASGPVVLAANHLTNYDVFPMQLVLPRPIFFMAKAELYKNPIMDAFLRQLGAFPVQRGKRDEWAMQQALRVLEQKQVLGIFPEGTRSRGMGLQPAKTGAARLALAANCPVVPLALINTQQMFDSSPKRAHISISVGAPLFPRRGETALALTDRLMFTLAELLPSEQRGVYAERPDWLI